MKSIENQDERVLTQKRRIQSDGFQLLIYALIISVLVQQFFLQAPPSQYMAELLCLIASGFYNIIRHVKCGNNIYGEYVNSGNKIFKNSLLAGVPCVIFVFVLNGESNIVSLITCYLIFILLYGGMSYLFYYLGKKKQDQIKRDLDMDEDNIE